jgi:pimeloyl-ACP methyl ester carboxylesterase
MNRRYECHEGPQPARRAGPNRHFARPCCSDPETGDALAPAVAAFGARYRLIIPDLRGFGRSQRPTSGYDKKAVATDIKLLITNSESSAST